MTLDSLNTNTFTPDTSYDPFREVFMKDMRDLQARYDVVLRYVQSSATGLHITNAFFQRGPVVGQAVKADGAQST